MALVGYFSFAPAHRQLEENQAVIALAFGHAGERIEECRTLSPEELAELPANMRAPTDCPRRTLTRHGGTAVGRRTGRARGR